MREKNQFLEEENERLKKENGQLKKTFTQKKDAGITERLNLKENFHLESQIEYMKKQISDMKGQMELMKEKETPHNTLDIIATLQYLSHPQYNTIQPNETVSSPNSNPSIMPKKEVSEPEKEDTDSEGKSSMLKKNLDSTP